MLNKEKRFTDEQLEFINDNKSNILLASSLAGTGKTTTLIEKFTKNGLYNILYLVYNKTMAEEAEREMKHLPNVVVSTFHALAYKAVGYRYEKKLTESYTPLNIIQDLGLEENDYEYAYNLLNLYNELLLSGAYSANEFLNKIDYTFATKDRIRNDFIKLFELMYDTESDVRITHDFYAYLYHLQKPHLNMFDIIAVDECQDSNANILEILKRFEGKIYLIGDTHQNIYAWRNTINLFDYFKDIGRIVNFTYSHRVSQEIADVCNKMYSSTLGININMKGLNPRNVITRDINTDEKHVYICRKRMLLFDKAYNYAINHKFIAFEGGFNKYGFELFVDAWFFKCGKEPYNHFLRKFKTWADFVAYVEESEDEEFSLLLNVIKTKGPRIVEMYNTIKESVVTKRSGNYNVLFTTIHRSKGQTYYNPLIIGEDVLDMNDVSKTLSTLHDNEYHKKLYIKSIIDELNILYVAITRCTDKIILPTHLYKWYYEEDDFVL